MIKIKEFFKNKKILITGGAGLLGVSLTKLLSSMGAYVISTFYTRRPPKKYSNFFLNKLFEEDFNRAVLDFNKNYNFKNLSKNKKEALIEMIFQLGIKKFKKFKKFIKFLEKRLFYLAALEMIDSLWYLQTPRRVELVMAIFLDFKNFSFFLLFLLVITYVFIFFEEL